MRFACWITEAANTHSVCVILTVSPPPTATTRLNVTFTRTLLVVLRPNNIGNCKKAHTEQLFVLCGKSCSSVSLITVAIGMTASVTNFKQNTIYIQNLSCVLRSTRLCVQVWLSNFHDEFVSFPRNWQWLSWLRNCIIFLCNKRFIAMFRRACPYTLSWARIIQSTFTLYFVIISYYTITPPSAHTL